MSDIKHLDIAEFREHGYLQELNRQFLHPLGLALEIVVEVWDCRDDPEGIYFAGDYLELRPRADAVAALADSRRAAREGALGYWVQPASAKTEA